VSISESPDVDNFKAGIGLIREMSPGLIFNHQSSSWQNNGAPFGALNPETHAKRKWGKLRMRNEAENVFFDPE